MRVKIFYEGDDLEGRINLWLEKHDYSSVISIQLQTNSLGASSTDYSVLITYDPLPKENKL